MSPQEEPLGSESGLFLPTGGKATTSPFKQVRVKVYFKKMEKVMEGEEIVLSPETTAILETQREKCMLCKMILEDQAQNGKLTGYPKENDGKGMFPVEAKIRHVQIEKLHSPDAGVGAAPPPQQKQGESDER